MTGNRQSKTTKIREGGRCNFFLKHVLIIRVRVRVLLSFFWSAKGNSTSLWHSESIIIQICSVICSSHARCLCVCVCVCVLSICCFNLNYSAWVIKLRCTTKCYHFFSSGALEVVFWKLISIFPSVFEYEVFFSQM